MVSNSLAQAEGPSDGNDQERLNQLRVEAGFANWQLKNAGFLKVDPKTRLSAFGGYWFTTFKFNERWGFTMGFGIQRREAKVSTSSRSGEAFPDPFKFDNPQKVNAFTIEQMALPIPLRARYNFSKDGGFYVESGPEIAFTNNLKYQYTESNKTISYDLDNKTNFIKLDFDLDVGYSFNWGGDLWSLGMNSFYQITPVPKNTNLKMTPMGVNVYVQYEL
jgi:hypothetical protein